VGLWDLLCLSSVDLRDQCLVSEGLCGRWMDNQGCQEDGNLKHKNG